MQAASPADPAIWGRSRERHHLSCRARALEPKASSHENRGMPSLASLVVVVGPIASGKSSVAARVAELLLASAKTSAVVDLDDVAECLVAPASEWEATWRRARQVHDELVASFRRSGVHHVVAHGSFFYADEPSSTASGVGDDEAVRVLLSVPYEVALQRVREDPDRGVTKDPNFLLWTHERFAERAPSLPTFELQFDTTVASVDEIAGAVVSRLVS